MLLVADGPVGRRRRAGVRFRPSRRHRRGRSHAAAASRPDLKLFSARAAGGGARAAATARRTGSRRSTPSSCRSPTYPAQFFSPPNSWRFLLQAIVPIFDSGQRVGAEGASGRRRSTSRRRTWPARSRRRGVGGARGARGGRERRARARAARGRPPTRRSRWSTSRTSASAPAPRPTSRSSTPSAARATPTTAVAIAEDTSAPRAARSADRARPLSVTRHETAEARATESPLISAVSLCLVVPSVMVLLFVAAVLAGALNSVAGGGSFFTLPSLLYAGITPVVANATSTLALWPGSVSSAIAYRREHHDVATWLAARSARQPGRRPARRDAARADVRHQLHASAAVADAAGGR